METFSNIYPTYPLSQFNIIYCLFSAKYAYCFILFFKDISRSHKYKTAKTKSIVIESCRVKRHFIRLVAWNYHCKWFLQQYSWEFAIHSKNIMNPNACMKKVEFISCEMKFSVFSCYFGNNMKSYYKSVVWMFNWMRYAYVLIIE